MMEVYKETMAKGSFMRLKYEVEMYVHEDTDYKLTISRDDIVVYELEANKMSILYFMLATKLMKEVRNVYG